MDVRTDGSLYLDEPEHYTHRHFPFHINSNQGRWFSLLDIGNVNIVSTHHSEHKTFFAQIIKNELSAQDIFLGRQNQNEFEKESFSDHHFNPNELLNDRIFIDLKSFDFVFHNQNSRQDHHHHIHCALTHNISWKYGCVFRVSRSQTIS